jgi:hypothetical protein
MMDKRKLRQSAFADFMQSLEQLDELLGDSAEATVLDDGPQASETDRVNAFPVKASHQNLSANNQTRRALVNPDVDA